MADLEPGKEFWEEERAKGKREFAAFALRWGGLMVALISGFLFVLWRSGAVMRFSSSRIDQTTPARYRIYGIVRSAKTGEPVPWPVAYDDPSGRPPQYKGEGRFDGSFELHTIAEPHTVHVTAPGFRLTTLHVGKAWYLWMPSGEERVNIVLTPE